MGADLRPGVLAGLLDLDGGVKPEMVATDNASYSTFNIEAGVSGHGLRPLRDPDAAGDADDE
ncbi:hypothetical protein [Streptomyces sp. NPDC002328]|uniref:hypothetical protein n=1 Tax=Streptomyces sp. NPDC002328 TaxID=3364642 RepID=UPI003697C632